MDEPQVVCDIQSHILGNPQGIWSHACYGKLVSVAWVPIL